MSKTKSVIILAIAVISLVLGFWIFWHSKSGTVDTSTTINPAKTATTKSDEAAEKEINLPKATGNIDDIASGVISQIQSEKDNFANEDSDAESVGINQLDLDDFGQSYDENEF